MGEHAASSSHGTHIALRFAIPDLNADSARIIAAGYRVSGFALWHIVSVAYPRNVPPVSRPDLCSHHASPHEPEQSRGKAPA
jgi:hypothetical protein